MVVETHFMFTCLLNIFFYADVLHYLYIDLCNLTKHDSHQIACYQNVAINDFVSLLEHQIKHKIRL